MQTQVLVIGGGFGGVGAVQELQKAGIDTILVDRKDYFEVTYAVLRDVTDPEKNRNRARRQYRDFVRGSFVHSGVQELKPNSAILDNGQELFFDRVIIASGSRYPSLPLAKSAQATELQQRQHELSDYHQRLKSASDVLIIGGGVVGVELAGEIAFALPGVQVTLAHNTETLLDGFKPKAQKKALEQLTRLGVEVQFNSRYQLKGERYIDATSGRESSADLVFAATGTLPNNEFLTQHFGHTLDGRGFVLVDEGLAVIGQPGFYALGDIAAVGEAKLGYLALQQGTYLGKRIAKQLAGKSVKAYKRNPFMALVPTGQKTGVVQLPFAVSTWGPLVNMKQKDLFISKTYRSLVE